MTQEQNPTSAPQSQQSDSPRPGQNPFAKDAPRKTNPAFLPWVLVAVLTIAVAVLGGVLFAQTQELNRLRSGTPAAPAATPSNSQTPKAPPAPTGQQGQSEKYPKITDPATVKMLDELPKRQANDPQALGKPDAKVTLLVWSDYRCPFCSKWERETLPKLMPYVESGSLRIEHRDMVIFGEDSMRAAVGARAAGLQGKYWEFTMAIAKASTLSGHPPITEADVLKFAQEAGVADLEKFKKDLALSQLAQAAQAETQHGQSIGIKGTPFFVINHTPISGAVPTADFAEVIESYGGKR